MKRLANALLVPVGIVVTYLTLAFDILGLATNLGNEIDKVLPIFSAAFPVALISGSCMAVVWGFAAYLDWMTDRRAEATRLAQEKLRQDQETFRAMLPNIEHALQLYEWIPNPDGYESRRWMNHDMQVNRENTRAELNALAAWLYRLDVPGPPLEKDIDYKWTVYLRMLRSLAKFGDVESARATGEAAVKFIEERND